jgi:hypothetical protein
MSDNQSPDVTSVEPAAARPIFPVPANAPMTPAEREAFLKARRGRTILLGLSLVAFIVIVFLVTVLKMGASIADRPL